MASKTAPTPPRTPPDPLKTPQDPPKTLPKSHPGTSWTVQKIENFEIVKNMSKKRSTMVAYNGHSIPSLERVESQFTTVEPRRVPAVITRSGADPVYEVSYFEYFLKEDDNNSNVQWVLQHASRASPGAAD